jgi:hypothetical protein
MPCLRFAFLLAALLLSHLSAHSQSWIRINQMGYLPESVKVAVLVSKEQSLPADFSIHDALTDEEVWKSSSGEQFGPYAAFESGARLNFTDFDRPGAYYVRAGESKSPLFRIAPDV